MSSRARFAHNAQRIKWKNKLRVQCCCGRNSPIFQDNEDQTKDEQADAWWVNHTGLREIRGKVES